MQGYTFMKIGCDAMFNVLNYTIYIYTYIHVICYLTSISLNIKHIMPN